MNWAKWADRLFPYIEPLTAEQQDTQSASLEADVAAINAAKFGLEEQRALDEAQRVAAAEMERVRTSEAKATTYLAVLAALVPLVITLQGATWENKSGPAPEWLKLGILALAVVYVAAAGYHAFRTLRVTGFERIGEAEVTAAWRSPRPLQKLARSTLLASRRSRDAVNLKVTYIKVTHEHLLRAFGAFVLLLLLDPIFYAVGFQNDGSPGHPAPIEIESAATESRVKANKPVPILPARSADPETQPNSLEENTVLPTTSSSPRAEAITSKGSGQPQRSIQQPAD